MCPANYKSACWSYHVMKHYVQNSKGILQLHSGFKEVERTENLRIDVFWWHLQPRICVKLYSSYVALEDQIQ
jgi:hypothetical protein